MKQINPWIKHVQEYKKLHPNMKLKQVLIECKKTYKKK